MDCYFLKLKITEFIYNSDEYCINSLYESHKTEIEKENKEEKYEIEFVLKKSNEKYILKIINDKKGNKIPFTNYFNLSTTIKINNKENIE